MIDWGQVSLMVLAPHPDDEVIGCGGLMAKVAAAGGRVHVLFLTVGATQDFSARGQSTVDERLAEIERVAAHFSWDGWRVAWVGDEYHLRLDTVPQRELIHLVERGPEISLEALRPDVIVLPQCTDYNQDHRAAAAAALAACRPAPRADKFVPEMIWQSEAPMSGWLLGSPEQPDVIVELTGEQVEQKVSGMELYRSQTRAAGHPRSSETLRALARLRGSFIGALWGEAFVSRRLRA